MTSFAEEQNEIQFWKWDINQFKQAWLADLIACSNKNRSKKTSHFIQNATISNYRFYYTLYAENAYECQELLFWCRLYGHATMDKLQMKLYAKSIGRIRSLIQNKSGLHRREISDDSITYIVLCPSCYQSTQYTSQSGDLDDADSLAFLHELFESKYARSARWRV